MLPNIKEKLNILPTNPGCYLMKDKNGEVIYVGKAKVLRSRVKSYFSGSHDIKTMRLVSEIHDFEYIVTNSDLECLILENNLIKQYHPKYNILLKDDKHYPYIKITKEDHPRLVISRGIKKDGAKYFGPYPSAGEAVNVKILLDRLYPLRKCKVMPKKVCLYYHIGQCLAPCEFNVAKDVTKDMVKEITQFLQGDTKKVVEGLNEKMIKASEEMKYELASEYRDTVLAIHRITEKQQMDLLDLADRDVFGFSYDKGWMCVQVFFIRNGTLIQRDVSIFPFYGEPEEDVLTFIGQFYERHAKPKEVLVPLSLDTALISTFIGTNVQTPKRGKKRNLVELANQNANISLKEKFSLIERNEERTVGAVEKLGKMLNIDTPYRVEMFDNSNLNGVDPVSAMVVFINGKAMPKEYRKYHIKTVQGPDDYATMREVVYRRYARLQKENKAFPDLILVDGGKGQISAAKDALSSLGIEIPLGGISKDEKHRTSNLLFGSPPEPIEMKRDSDEFYLLMRLQDEVHRFAIEFFRKQNKKTNFKSFLDEITGIGTKRKKALLKHFQTKERMKSASIEEYKKVGIPIEIAESIIRLLNEKN